MRGHRRPRSVWRVSSERQAAERARQDEKVRGEAVYLLGERSYTLTAFAFEPGRGTYRLNFVATDDPESAYEARDQTVLLDTIRIYPPRGSFNSRHPRASRFANSAAITLAFLDAGREALHKLGDYARPHLT